ncbi:MAG: glycosyltransferase family 2 protein [Acidobacteria bacterium]|nr:glycosyltransferase family 2 protein [Acidobacteriota bacterium]
MAVTPHLSFAVVVPMYNEESGARECILSICPVLRGLDLPSALIVVNDGSRDRTGSILTALEPEWPELRVITHPANRGYGAALRTGVEHAAAQGFTYVLFMDSDLTNHPSDLPLFVAMMRRNFDVIKATRYSKGGQVHGVPAWRVSISRAGNLLARVLFRLPLADCTNGFRAVRTSLFEPMRLTETRFPIIMEELYWCKFLAGSFAEIPVTLTDRGPQQRPTSFHYHPRVFYDYLKYPLKGFLGIRPRL